jgi:VIT1/CCC1 family predicted Fe2+/Mn2+ transporter
MKEARIKGQIAASETHGVEMAGSLSAATDAAKETALFGLLLWSLHQNITTILIFFSAWLVWKVGRSALLGYSRLERVHRLISEEQYAIEHHRHDEKQELKLIYQAKGFSGKLLDEVVEVLMKDDNRLLQEMLEEELGLSLENFEHPLKQAFGAFLGVVTSILLVILCSFYIANLGTFIASMLVIFTVSYIEAKFQKNDVLSSIVWNVANGFFALSVAYFLQKILA